jgi:hypothetical protein
LRVIETVDVVARFSQQVGVAALTARHVEKASANWQPKYFYQAGGFCPIALEREERSVLQKVV